MSVQPARRLPARSESSVLTPTRVTVGLLTVWLAIMLVLYLVVSVRSPERHSAPPPAPVHVPTVPSVPAASSAPGGDPTAGGTRAVEPSVGADPDAGSSPARPTPRADQPRAGRTAGAVAASYQVVAVNGDTYQARLVVRNDAGRAEDWQAALVFSASAVQVSSSGPGMSIIQSSGNVVLRGASPLAAGARVTIEFRLVDDANAGRPAACVLNGTPCAVR